MNAFKRKFVSEALSPVALLVETSEDHASLFERNFAKIALHWRLIKVPDGSSAVLHMIHHGFPNLFVTCLQTPRLDAFDIVEWIRAMKSPAPVPVLIYNGEPSTILRTQLGNLGVHDYLDKRVPEEKLLQTLARLIEKIERGDGKISSARKSVT